MTDTRKIVRLLLARYPEPKLALRYAKPLELLIAVMLSAQCTDARVNEVTRTLFKKYRSADDYAGDAPAAFEQDIRATGFYRSKTRSILGCCRKLVSDFGGRVPRTLEDLLSLPGVGRKTANMVLGNAFGVPAIAVDTHVLRVANRLGLAHTDDPWETEQALAARLPREHWTALSNALVLHGRDTCHARKPACWACVLYPECGWPGKLAQEKAKAKTGAATGRSAPARKAAGVEASPRVRVRKPAR